MPSQGSQSVQAVFAHRSLLAFAHAARRGTQKIALANRDLRDYLLHLFENRRADNRTQIAHQAGLSKQLPAAENAGFDDDENQGAKPMTGAAGAADQSP